jgi:hypothetical protein
MKDMIKIEQTHGVPNWPLPPAERILDGFFYANSSDGVWYDIQPKADGSVWWRSGFLALRQGEPKAMGYIYGIKMGFTIHGWGQMEPVIEFVTPGELEEKLNSLGNVRLRGVTKAWMPA